MILSNRDADSKFRTTEMADGSFSNGGRHPPLARAPSLTSALLKGSIISTDRTIESSAVALRALDEHAQDQPRSRFQTSDDSRRGSAGNGG